LFSFVGCVPSCMQNEYCSACRRMGGNNSPPSVLLLGQADSGPALWVFFLLSGPSWFWPRHFVFIG
jgi:hypothetical protein